VNERIGLVQPRIFAVLQQQYSGRHAMRSSLLPIVALAALTACSSSASAQTETRDYPLSGFDRVDLAAAGDVTVTNGPRFSIHAEGDADAIERLEPVVRDSTLVLGWKKGFHIGRGHQKLRIAVTMPRVAGATLSGAGSVTVDKAGGQTVDAALSGSGKIIVRQIAAQTAALHISGSGDITAGQVDAKMAALHISGSGHIVTAGRADRIEAHVSGVGSIEAQKLAAHDGDLHMSGSGSIEAHADGTVNAQVSGVGSIDVTGGAHCTTRKSGVGSIDCH
jgi:hypothetical protein